MSTIDPAVNRLLIGSLAKPSVSWGHPSGSRTESGSVCDVVGPCGLWSWQESLLIEQKRDERV